MPRPPLLSLHAASAQRALNTHESRAVAAEGLDRQRLGEQVGAVVRGRDVLDAHDAHRLELAHLEEAAVDVA